MPNGEFMGGFVFTLCLVVGLAGLVGVVWLVCRVWLLLRPFRDCLGNSRLVRFVKTFGRMLGETIGGALKMAKEGLGAVISAIATLVWRTLVAVFLGLPFALSHPLRAVPWDICLGILAAYCLALLVFAAVGVPLKVILGVEAAGMVIGLFCAPIVIWRYGGMSGFRRAVGLLSLTVVGGEDAVPYCWWPS